MLSIDKVEDKLLNGRSPGIGAAAKRSRDGPLAVRSKAACLTETTGTAAQQLLFLWTKSLFPSRARVGVDDGLTLFYYFRLSVNSLVDALIVREVLLGMMFQR
jgi:hypothetical protein